MNTIKITAALRRMYSGFAVLLIIALLGCLYYYYINNREKKLEAFNFRVLQGTEIKLERRIQDNRQLLISKLKVCTNCNKTNYLQVDKVKNALINDEVFTYSDALKKENCEWEITNNAMGKGSVFFYIRSSELDTNSKSELCFSISADIEKIMNGVLRNDVFPAYALTNKHEMVFNTCREISQIPGADTLIKNDEVSEVQLGSGSFVVFSHPFSKGVNKNIILCGIVPSQQYSSSRYSIPSAFLLTLILLMLVILLAFPFIKSFLMSPEETLDTGDILIALLSLFILCYMYVFIHMHTYTVFRDENAKEEMLKTTSNQIKTTFLNELNNIQKQLKDYDAKFASSTDSLNKGDISKSEILRPMYYNQFSRVFWLDNNGTQICEWMKEGKPSNQSSNFKDRDYFKAVKNNALWYPDSSDENKMYFEPIYSRTDGSFRAVMSIKSKRAGAKVAVLSCDLKSLINTIQPGELNFNVVNDLSEVLFTSAGNEHFNENLLEECDNNQSLKTALSSRANTNFDSRYTGIECSFYVSPIEGLPLHLVTYTDAGIIGETQLQVCIFTSLFVLTVLLLFSLVILFFIFLKEEPQNKIIKKPFFDISWLYPSSRFVYRDFGGIFFNLILIIAILIASYVCRDEPFSMIMLFLINAAATTIAFGYSRVDLNQKRRVFFWVAVILFLILSNLTLIYAGVYKNMLSMSCVLIYEGLTIGVIYLLRTMRYCEKDFADFALRNENGKYIEMLKTRSIIQKAITKLHYFISSKVKFQFYHQYSCMLATWFLLIALLPSVFVYRYFYQQENENYIKGAQLNLARQIFDKVNYDLGAQAVAENAAENVMGRSYLEGFYDTRILSEFKEGHTSSPQKSVFQDYMSNFRYSSKLITAHNRISIPAETDSTILFSSDAGSVTLKYSNLLNHPGSEKNNTIIIQSRLPGFPAPSITQGIPFLIYFLSPIIFLFLLYLVINYFIKRFFLFEVLPNKVPDDEGFNQYFYNKYNSGNIKLLILGVTSSGKKALIKNAAGFIFDKQNITLEEGPEKEKAKAHFIAKNVIGYDLAEIDQVIKDLSYSHHQANDILLFNHFEDDLGESITNDKKYSVISKVFQMKDNQPHLVILSNIHPSVFLNNLKGEKNTESLKAEDYINQKDYYNWTGLLSGFEIYTKAFKEDRENQSLYELYDETDIYNSYKSKYLFYLSIWNSLERVEKFVLFDIAKDNLVNFRNKTILFSLYNKGLIVQNEVPKIMNSALLTFIRSEIKEEDVELDKKKSGSSSAWNTFKMPFLMILIGVLLFIFLTQQETFNKLMATIVAFAGSIPVLIKLLSISQSFKQEK